MTEVSKEDERGLCNLSTTVLSTPSPKTARQDRVPKATGPTLQQAWCQNGDHCMPRRHPDLLQFWIQVHPPVPADVSTRAQQTAGGCSVAPVFQQIDVLHAHLSTTGRHQLLSDVCSTPPAPKAHSRLRQAQHRFRASRPESSCATAAGRSSARQSSGCQRTQQTPCRAMCAAGRQAQHNPAEGGGTSHGCRYAQYVPRTQPDHGGRSGGGCNCEGSSSRAYYADTRHSCEGHCAQAQCRAIAPCSGQGTENDRCHKGFSDCRFKNVFSCMTLDACLSAWYMHACNGHAILHGVSRCQHARSCGRRRRHAIAGSSHSSRRQRRQGKGACACQDQGCGPGRERRAQQGTCPYWRCGRMFVAGAQGCVLWHWR